MEMKTPGRKSITYNDIIKRAYEVFGEKDNALNWYLKPSMVFENKSPYEYAKMGKQEKVLKFLDAIIYSN